MNTRERILRAMQGCAPSSVARDAALRFALEDAVANLGKMVRGNLVAAACEALGVEEARADLLAAAIEYFHTASLLLDDLPCMDNAKLRRGLPCVHAVHGESTAILSALSLISRAYLLCEMALSDQVESRRLQAHLLIERCLGASGLAAGQAADLHFGEAADRVRESGRIALLKTGGLFQLCLLLPAIPANADEGEALQLRRIATYWSLAYQIADDLRDMEGSALQDGKTTGQDRRLGRPNLALSAGRQAAVRRLERLEALSLQAMTSLENFHSRWRYLGEFHRVLFQASSQEAAA